MHYAIKEEFTDLRLPGGRRLRLRRQRDRLCLTCGEPAVGASDCLKHGIENRQRVRSRKGTKVRWKAARTYRLADGGGKAPPGAF